MQGRWSAGMNFVLLGDAAAVVDLHELLKNQMRRKARCSDGRRRLRTGRSDVELRCEVRAQGCR